MHERVFRASNAHKLEDPQRLVWLPPLPVISLLSLTSGMSVADIGAGTGFFAIPMARQVGEAGTVFAVDMQKEMLEILEGKLKDSEVPANIRTVVGDAASTGLEDATCDRVLLAKIWHELEDQDGTLRECRRLLKRGGKLAILEWRNDVSRPPGPPMEERISQDALRGTLEAKGWHVEGQFLVGDYSYLMLASLDS